MRPESESPPAAYFIPASADDENQEEVNRLIRGTWPLDGARDQIQHNQLVAGHWLPIIVALTFLVHLFSFTF